MEELYETFPKECEDDITELGEYLSNMAQACDVTEWKGHKFGAIFSPKTVKFACTEWDLRDGDVVIATFARTGTHWAKECVRQLLYANDEKLDRISYHLPMALLYIEMGPVCSFNLMDKLPLPRRVFLTHLPANLLPLDKWLQKDVRVINVIRNPKDQAVSWYHFSQKFPYFGVGIFEELVPKDWGKWLENYMSGRIPCNMKDGEFYPDNILTWQPYKSHPKVLFLTYENMLQDPIGNVKKISEFIGCDADEKLLKHVTMNTSFTKMKKDLFSQEDGDSKLAQSMERIRTGVVGGWKNYFTVAQSEKMDGIIKEKLSDTGIQFTYE